MLFKIEQINYTNHYVQLLDLIKKTTIPGI